MRKFVPILLATGLVSSAAAPDAKAVMAAASNALACDTLCHDSPDTPGESHYAPHARERGRLRGGGRGRTACAIRASIGPHCFAGLVDSEFTRASPRR